MPPSCVGISPAANEGAVFQMTPLAGVLAGTRLEPLITMNVFCAIVELPFAVVTEVIVDVPDLGCVIEPDPVSVQVVLLGLRAKLALSDPVAPLKIPVPPVMVQGRLVGALLKRLNTAEKDATKLSVALKVKVNAP